MNYDLVAFWSQILGFVLFAGILAWGFARFITPAIRSAQLASNERIAAAERHRDEMRASLEVLRAQIGVANHDAALIKTRATEQAHYEYTAIVAEAKASGERVLRNASGELERARSSARDSVRSELASKALDLARTQAQSRVTGTVNAQLVQGFIALLERGGAN